MSTKPEVDRTITQLALFMQARDAKQFGATVDGQLTPSWDEVGPAAQEEYLRDAGAFLGAAVALGCAVPGELEAAEAELTRRDTVIAATIKPREIATDALTGFAPGADIDRDDVWQLIVGVVESLAAAPVSLEAVKAETHDHEFEDRCYCGLTAAEYFAERRDRV